MTRPDAVALDIVLAIPFSRDAWLLQLNAFLAPAFAYASAIAKPIPWAVTVTRAVFPMKSWQVFSTSGWITWLMTR